MLINVEYINAMNDFGEKIKNIFNLSEEEVHRIKYELNLIVEGEIERSKRNSG